MKQTQTARPSPRWEPYWDGLLRALDEEGILYVDLAPVLAAHGPPAALFREVHLNPAANGVVAAHLKDWLDEPL